MQTKPEQPSEEVKLQTLRGEKTGWDYRFHVPSVATGHWTYGNWIIWIGDNWFRK